MTKNEEKIFIKKLKKALFDAGFTQATLAEKLNKTQAAISKWMHGKAIPPMGVLEQVAELTNKPINYFFSDDSTHQTITGNNNTQSNTVNKDLELLKAQMEILKKTQENFDLRLKILEKNQ